jgi:tetratricopeptide (TPR) repeat protein
MVFRTEKNRLWAVVALLVGVLLLSGNPAFGFTARVTGTVTDVNGNPLPKVQVFFEADTVDGRAQGLVVGKLKTKKNGGFTYPFLDTGLWKIYPQFDGYLVLKMSYVSVDSNGDTRADETDLKISQDQTNLPAIPVAPQGGGANVRGRCEVHFVMVPEADYKTEMAKLQGAKAPVAAASVAPGAARKRDPKERGDEFYAGGDYAGAAAAYQEAVDADAEDAEAYYGLGKTQLRADDISGAQTALMKAAQLDPEMPGVNFYLGTIYHSLAQTTAAIAAFEKERINSPDQEEVLVNLASLYRDSEQPDKAMEVLTEVMALNPENTDAALAMADVYNLRGETADAEAIYLSILEKNPGQQDVIWYNIGVNAFNNDNRAEAAQAFEKSLEANKKNSDAHKMLGYTLVGMGKPKEAIPHFEAYLKLEKGPDAEQVAAVLEQLRKG